MFDINYKFLTDYIFFIKLSKLHEIHCSKEILSIWRSHNDQATVKMSKYYFYEMFILYNNILFKEKIDISIKLIILKKYIRLIISFFFNKIFK